MSGDNRGSTTTRKEFLVKTAVATAGVAVGAAALRTTSAEAAASQMPSSAGNPVTLRFMHHEQTYSRELTTSINNFMKAYPNIKIEQEPTPWVDSFNLLINDAATGHIPDLMVLGDTWASAFASQGMLQPLDKWLNNWKLANGKPAVTEWYAGDKLFYSLRGHYYGVPFSCETRALIYRKDWFAEAGISGPPKTHDEFLTVAKKLTNPSKNRYGYGLVSSVDGVTFQQIMTWITQRGGSLFKKVSYGLAANTDSREFIAALQWYVDLALKHKVAPSSFTNFAISDAEDGFQGGSLGMIVDGVGFLPTLRANSKMTGRWAVALLPKGPANNYAFLGGVPICMASQTKHPEEAWAFMKWMTTPQNELTYLRAAYAFPGWTSGASYQPWSSDPELKIFAQELRLARPNSYPFAAPPVLASMTDGQMPLQYEVQSILAGQETVAQGAERATVGINTMLRQYYHK